MLILGHRQAAMTCTQGSFLLWKDARYCRNVTRHLVALLYLTEYWVGHPEETNIVLLCFLGLLSDFLTNFYVVLVPPSTLHVWPITISVILIHKISCYMISYTGHLLHLSLSSNRCHLLSAVCLKAPKILFWCVYSKKLQKCAYTSLSIYLQVSTWEP
jgi:hypothetical protein